jgi:cytochrome c553
LPANSIEPKAKPSPKPGLPTPIAAFAVTLATQAADQPINAKLASTDAAGISSKTQTKASEADSTYLRDVLPILMGRCARSHNGQGLLPNWLDYKTTFGHRAEIKRRVWDSWKGTYFKQPMPAGNSQECESITEEERATIREWVRDGGVYGVPPTEHGPKSKQERMELGQKLFNNVCAACHQTTGLGIPDKFPPLAASDFLNADKNRAIRTLINGRQVKLWLTDTSSITACHHCRWAMRTSPMP